MILWTCIRVSIITRGIAAVRNALETRANKTALTDCILVVLEICLKCKSSTFGPQNILQLNGTTTSTQNSCLYADLAVFNIDKNILQAKRNTREWDILVDIMMIA